MSYKDLGEYEKSLGCGLRSLELLAEGGDKEAQAMALCNIGNTYASMQEYAAAAERYAQALALMEESEDRFQQAYTRLSWGRTCFQQKQYSVALHHIIQALRVAEVSNQRGFQFECHEMLAAIYKEQGNFAQALAHYERFHQIKCAVFNEEAERKVKALEVIHRVETTRKEAEVYRLKYAQLEEEIAEHRRTEAELKVTVLELGETLERLKSTQRQLNTAEAANRLKDQFLTLISHELRTPLSVILLHSEILQRGIHGALFDKHKPFVEQIQANGQRLSNMINKILDLTQIASEQLALTLHPCSARSIGEHSVQVVQPLAQQKQICLHFTHDDQSIALITDEKRVRQILVDLLDNAIKFSPRDSSIGLNLAHDCTQQTVQFTVWDHGIGIDPCDQAALFQPFRQLDSSLTREHQGAGLGLALVARLTHLLGGQVTVESVPGQGSSFSLILPWHTADPYTQKSALPAIDVQVSGPLVG
jgi:signal transduction histidine kinase